MIRAVIDVGSNSVLLTVAQRDKGAWRVIKETSKVSGLGRGTKQTGKLSQEGMTDTLEALWEAAALAREEGAHEVVAAATMAARIASNTDDFLARAAAQGTPVTVLSGEEEAELGLRAVLDDPLFADCGRLTVIDIGGHSSELVTWAAGAVEFRHSFPLGTLALRGGLLHEQAPGSEARMRAVGEIDDALGLEYLPGRCGTTVTLGATGTNLITVRERMTVWDPERVHGASLSYEEVGRAVGWLLGMNDQERRELPGMEPGRESTVHIGALILERFMHAIHSEECRVSVRGWRYALLDRGLHEARL